jgi:hypothetical protein
MVDKTFIKHDNIQINNKNRVLYKKSSSKSDNPILYIKKNNKYITYKSYLKKIKGGTNMLLPEGMFIKNVTIFDPKSNFFDRKDIFVTNRGTIYIKDDMQIEPITLAGKYGYIIFNKENDRSFSYSTNGGDIENHGQFIPTKNVEDDAKKIFVYPKGHDDHILQLDIDDR